MTSRVDNQPTDCHCPLVIYLSVHNTRPGHRPLQVVATPPPWNLVVLLTHCGQLVLRIKYDATGCQLLRLKCTKFDFRWSSAPDPAGGA